MNVKKIILFSLILLMAITAVSATTTEHPGPEAYTKFNPNNPTYQQVADVISVSHPDDLEFVNAVKTYVFQYIPYNTTGKLSIMSPERTWRERRGDCSEYALLITEMLKPRIADAHVTHGKITDGDLHDSVEMTINSMPYRFDQDELPEYVSYGEGIFQGEYVIS